MSPMYFRKHLTNERELNSNILPNLFQQICKYFDKTMIGKLVSNLSLHVTSHLKIVLTHEEKVARRRCAFFVC